MTERWYCENSEPHLSHRWGIGWADMGTIWYECPGVEERRIDPSRADEGKQTR